MKQLLVKTGKKLLNWTLLGLVLHMLTAFLPVRRAEISSFMNFSSNRASVGFFGNGEFMYSGGVVPRGAAVFFTPDGTRISGNEISLTIIDKNKIGNGDIEYDAIGIRWGNEIYKISMQDELLYPLMKFVNKGTYTAYTIPPNSNPQYFANKGFIKVGGGYIAPEFMGYESFLRAIDLHAAVEPLPLEKEKAIIQQFSSLYINKEFSNVNVGSYVNADFHITYQVYLETMNGENVADIAGLPLRYDYEVNKDNKPIIQGVQIFHFPDNEEGLQYNAVIFFQAAAILRYFKHRNPGEFARFMNEVAVAFGEK